MNENPYQAPSTPTNVTTKRHHRRKLLWLLTVVLPLILFPPLRPVHHWVDANGDRPDPSHAYELDRFWSGYLPYFRCITTLVQHEERKGITTSVAVRNRHPFTIMNASWRVDWIWVGIESWFVLALAAYMNRERPRKEA